MQCIRNLWGNIYVLFCFLFICLSAVIGFGSKYHRSMAQFGNTGKMVPRVGRDCINCRSAPSLFEKVSKSAINLLRLGRPVSSSVRANTFSSPKFRACLITMVMRIKAKNKVAIVGAMMKIGKAPGTSAE